jgi:hypothetical protein
MDGNRRTENLIEAGVARACCATCAAFGLFFLAYAIDPSRVDVLGMFASVLGAVGLIRATIWAINVRDKARREKRPPDAP